MSFLIRLSFITCEQKPQTRAPVDEDPSLTELIHNGAQLMQENKFEEAFYHSSLPKRLKLVQKIL